MFRFIGSLIAVTGLALGAGQSAEAHGNDYRGHDTHAYRYSVFYRTQHMPRWLKRQRDFRRWYAHTPLRFDRRLHWWELHDAYRWERRHRGRKFYRSRYSVRHYDYDYDRDDRRDRRGKKRRRARDDD